MKSQNTKKQLHVKSKALMIMVTIAILAFSGCQEASTVTNVQRASIQNQPTMSDRIVTLAVFPEKDSFTHTELKDIYLLGTRSYAEKLMSIYEESSIPTLPANSNHLSYENPGCVPILVITY